MSIFCLLQDDILCAVFCPPNLMATGSFDGEIIVWGLETEKIYRRLRRGGGGGGGGGGGATATTVASVAGVSVAGVGGGVTVAGVGAAPLPVDKLAFLQGRLGVPYNYANLVSSEGERERERTAEARAK